jgi:glycosyltransferase involved in cell wall biosynthesis
VSARIVGVDARELLGATTGVGRYLGELLRRWTGEAGRSRRFVLYSPAPLSPFFTEHFDTRVVPGQPGTSWEQLRLRRAVNTDAPDVFFAPAYTAPLGISVPFAVTIHDVSFSAHPEWFRWREGTRRRLVTRRAARAAAGILTVSQFSRSEIAHYYDVPLDRIEVIPQGVTRRSPGGPEAREPLVLFAGSIFNRRRLPDLIAAFAIVARDLSAARLVIVGENRTWPPQDLAALARSHGVADRVELRHYASEHDLAALYARARTFAFLSEYEGFGLTPLEAMSANVPVVVLDTAVAREVYGPAARYVGAGDIGGAAAALRDLLTTPRTDIPELSHAPAVLDRYSWDTAAARTLDALDRIASR